MARRLPILIIFTLLLALAPARTAEAQRKKLRVGDAAPTLDVEEWVNGSPVTFERGTTYFVFFFEIPDEVTGTLTFLVLEYLQNLTAVYDFQVVGVTSSSKAKAQSAAAQFDGKLSVPIGIDNRKRTERAWVQAGSVETQNGSTMFIVDSRGKIQFMGVPEVDDLDSFVPAILSQRFDAELSRRTRGLRSAKDTARRVKNWRLYEQHHAELMELDKSVFALANVEKFETLILDRDDRDAAYAFIGELRETYADDPRFLLDLGAFIAESRKLTDEQRDLDVAMELVLQAKGSMRDDNPRPLSIEALVLLRQGDVAGAVRTQRRAFRVAPTALKPRYQKTLEDYQEIRDQRRNAGG